MSLTIKISVFYVNAVFRRCMGVKGIDYFSRNIWTPFKMMQCVMLAAFLEGDKIFQRGPNISSKSGPGVQFLGGPNISLQAYARNYVCITYLLIGHAHKHSPLEWQ